MAKQVTAFAMADILRGFAVDVPAECLKAVHETLDELAGPIVKGVIDRTRPHKPVDEKNYRDGWRVKKTAAGGQVYNITKQAVWIERGRRPGGKVGGTWRGLIPWAARKGMSSGIAFVIAKKIAAEGYKPRWVMKRSMRAARNRLRARIKEKLGKRFKK
jgi:hypothetical protein